MKVFKDIEGKIKAQVGDRVALAIPDDAGEIHRQAVESMRPTLEASGVITFDGEESLTACTPKPN
jgi:hypothetical protein